MDNPETSSTSVSLLELVGRSPPDPEAWNRFLRRYAGQIYAWCRQWHLQEADAEDVTQAVLLKLFEKMHGFRYDPAGSFRGWLRTLAHHAWHDFVEGRRRAGAGSGDSTVVELLASVEARDELARQLEEEFDRELFEVASARVRLRVQPHTWESFRLLAVEGLSGAEAASRLGMKVAAVFVARSKVQKMLQEELRRLAPPEVAQPEDSS